MVRYRYDSKGNLAKIISLGELTEKQKAELIVKNKPEHDDKIDRKLWWALNQLPPKEKDAIELYYLKNYKELSQEKIAFKLGVDISTFKRRLKQAKDKLSKLL